MGQSDLLNSLGNAAGWGNDWHHDKFWTSTKSESSEYRVYALKIITYTNNLPDALELSDSTRYEDERGYEADVVCYK